MLYPKTPPNGPAFKADSGQRFSAERVFKREKNDYTLTPFPVPSKGGPQFYTMRTVSVVRIDTW